MHARHPLPAPRPRDASPIGLRTRARPPGSSFPGRGAQWIVDPASPIPLRVSSGLAPDSLLLRALDDASTIFHCRRQDEQGAAARQHRRRLSTMRPEHRAAAPPSGDSTTRRDSTARPADSTGGATRAPTPPASGGRALRMRRARRGPLPLRGLGSYRDPEALVAPLHSPRPRARVTRDRRDRESAPQARPGRARSHEQQKAENRESGPSPLLENGFSCRAPPVASRTSRAVRRGGVRPAPGPGSRERPRRRPR